MIQPITNRLEIDVPENTLLFTANAVSIVFAMGLCKQIPNKYGGKKVSYGSSNVVCIAAKKVIYHVGSTYNLQTLYMYLEI